MNITSKRLRTVDNTDRMTRYLTEFLSDKVGRKWNEKSI